MGAQLDALALGHGLRVVDRVLRHRAQVFVPQLQRDQAGIELRELQQVGRQPVESLQLLAAAAQELVAGLRVLRGSFEQQLVEGAQAAIGVRSSWD